MSEHSTDHTSSAREDEQPPDEIRYPTDHVLGVLDAEAQLTAAVQALRGGGFLESELHVTTGQAAADRLDASTGRSGLAGLAIRIAETLGIENDEMQLKSRYEDAMRDGHFVIAVAAATDERKGRAAELLREHGAHTVASFGRFTYTGIVPPRIA
jgi:hypothetical protein